MITEVRVFLVTGDEYKYSTEEGEMDNDLEKIIIQGENYITLKLKDGSIDEFKNVSYCITTKKSEGDLIQSA